MLGCAGHFAGFAVCANALEPESWLIREYVYVPLSTLSTRFGAWSTLPKLYVGTMITVDHIKQAQI